MSKRVCGSKELFASLCVAIAVFWSRRCEKSVFSLYACLNIYHMFEFRQEQHLLKLTWVRITARQIPFSCLTQGIWAVLLTSVNQIMCRKLRMCITVFKIALVPIVSPTWFPNFFQFADPLKIFQWRCGPLGRVFKPTDSWPAFIRYLSQNPLKWLWTSSGL